MKNFSQIKEASYKGNMGFEEMMRFYEVASKSQATKLEKLLDEDDLEAAWDLVEKVTGKSLDRKTI